MFLGKVNSTSLSRLIGKMPRISEECELKKTFVIVEYWDKDRMIKATPGIFTSETKIIAYASIPETSTSRIETLGIVKARRVNSDSPIIVRSVNFENSIAKITVSFFESKYFYIFKL